jgi:ferric-dicitrate binding protein FerR (iron transport regulator)
MNQNRLWFLLARQLSEETSPEETAELQHLLSLYPDKQFVADLISTYFSAPASLTETDSSGIDLNQRLRRIFGQPSEGQNRATYEPYPENLHQDKKTVFSIRRWLPYAAALFAIGFTTWMIIPPTKHTLSQPGPAMQTSEVSAKPGARTKLVLPDGTQVWLNSGSKLHYKNDFNTALREVYLDGEAFFDVVKDANHPFIVHTSAINVKVLGTAFNIKSYPRDENIETTLLRGLIEVTRKDDPSAPKVILRPNEKLVFNKHINPEHEAAEAIRHPGQPQEQMSNIFVTPIPKNIPDSDKVETSWLYNKLVFDGDSFAELAAKMERWYNIKISFRNDQLLKYRFKGVFANETVKDAFDALRLTAQFSYTIKDNEIELDKR